MILIADSGSTKTEWLVLDNKVEILRFETIGLNPFFVDKETVIKTLANSPIASLTTQITQLDFYGAGCSNEEKCHWLQEIFQTIFAQATIQVFTDIEAAVRATSKGEPCIVCILGTGSTFRVFDGETIIKKYSSLSYILGDEGSGTHIAKALLKGVFYQHLSKELQNDFFSTYSITSDILLQKVYKEPQPNRYLASFVPFCKKHIDQEVIESIVLQSLDAFFQEHIIRLAEAQSHPIHFIGSIAFHFRKQLELIASKYNCRIGSVLQKPLSSLAKQY